MRLRPALPLALAVATLSGCPEERPDAKRPLPRERLPPAVSVQPSPTTAPATPAPDEDAARGDGAGERPAAEPTPAPAAAPGADGAPAR